MPVSDLIKQVLNLAVPAGMTEPEGSRITKEVVAAFKAAVVQVAGAPKDSDPSELDHARRAMDLMFVGFLFENGYLLTPVCPRHGGPWGADATCPECTDADGNPLDLKGH